MKISGFYKVNKQSVFYSSLLLFLSSVILHILGFVYRIVLSRNIGADGMGLFSLAMPVYAVLSSLVVSGIALSVSKLSAQNEKSIGKIMKNALSLFFCLFAFVGIVYALLCDSIATHFLKESRLKTALLLMLPCFLLTGIENITKSCFYGRKKVVFPIISELLEQIVRIASVFALLFILTPQTPMQAVTIIIFAMIISEIFSSSSMVIFYKCVFRKSSLQAGNTHTPKLFSQMISLTIPVSLSNCITTVIHAITTVMIPYRLVVAGLSWDEAISDFGILSGMTIPLLMLPTALIGPITTVIFPKISQGQSNNDVKDIRRKTAKSLHITSLICMPFLFIMIFFSRPIFILLYNQMPADEIVVSLCVCMMFAFFQSISNSILNATGYQKRVGASVILLSLVQIPINWFLVANESFMLRGYVVGELVCSMIGAILSFCWLIKSTGTKIMWANWFYSPIISSAIAGLLANLSYQIFSSLVLAIIAFFAIYFICLRACGVNFISYFASVFYKNQNYGVDNNESDFLKA